MSSTRYVALGGSRLAGRDRTIYWTEADPSASGLHHIVAASARGKLPVVRAIPLPPSRMRGLVATERHLIWHDGAMLRLAALAEGSEVMHVAEPGLAWLTCLIADRSTAYYARANDSGSVIGAVDPATATTRELAEVAGTVDQLVVVGDHLAWTLHGASDVFVQAVAGGAPALLYSASAPFALCAAGADHLVLAVGATLVRLALATAEVAPLADQLAAGWPHAVVWYAGVAYVARHEVVVGGTRLGSCVERVDLAEGTAHVVHAPAPDHRIDHMVANDHGAFCLEAAGSDLVAIVHITPEPVARTVIEQRGTRTGGGIRIDSAYGKLRAGFVGEVTSCGELIKRIASEAPRRLELLCAPASPGELWSSACIGHTLPSAERLVAPNGSLGQLADMFTALPSLQQAFVSGELALEPFEHAVLRELHFESETLRPTFAKAAGTRALRADVQADLDRLAAPARRRVDGVASAHHRPPRWLARRRSDPRCDERADRAACRVGAGLVQRSARR